MAEGCRAAPAMNFQPLNDYLLLRPIVPDEISGDAAVSHHAHALAEWGEVVAAGEQLASPVSKGERVAFRPASAIAIALAGEWFAMTKSADLLGTARAPSEPEPVAAVTVAAEVEREEWAEPVNRVREEFLDTDVAPDALDRAGVTGEDLH